MIASAQAWSWAPSLHVDATTGSDSTGDGSAAHPFFTIQRCLDVASGAAACEIAPGVYRESITIDNGSTVRGKHGVMISGLDVLEDVQWVKTSQPCVYRTAVNRSSISQLFFGGRMMIEARWPNIGLGNVGEAYMSKNAWRSVHSGSKYGHIVDPKLRSNFSWVGALATLNVGHQWNTWTRRVTAHQGDWIEYPQDLPGLAGYDPTIYPSQASVWDGCESQHAKCNQYWLSGKREALDAPGEWFYDEAEGVLDFYPPSCSQPSEPVEVKARDYAISRVQPHAFVRGVRLSGLQLFGATLRLDNCSGCVLSDLTLSYPTYDREIRELDATKGVVAATRIQGEHVQLHNLTLTQSNNNGLVLSGFNITLNNSLISYTDWVGALQYSPLGVTGNQMSITHCTVHDFGNAGVVTSIPNVPPGLQNDTGTQQPPEPMANRFLEVAYSHIFNGARVGEDTAALYSGGWRAAGTHWHHNWVHDTTEKCLRFDDQSENATIHHNVLYNCGEPEYTPSSHTASGFGLVAKGDGHTIYANTIFQVNASEMCLSGCIEKLKPFRKQYPRVMQNVHTQIFNTAANHSEGRCECGVGAPPGGNFTAVYMGSDLRLRDVSAHDYRPLPDSPLVDAGASIPPYTDGYVGAAPDIGAYELGGEHWQAGCAGCADKHA